MPSCYVLWLQCGQNALHVSTPEELLPCASHVSTSELDRRTPICLKRPPSWKHCRSNHDHFSLHLLRVDGSVPIELNDARMKLSP